MTKKIIEKTLAAALVTTATFHTGELLAAGFYLKEQSIVSQGQAFAGVAAQSGIASAAYFNPAGLATLESSVVEGGVHVIVPDQKVNGSISSISSTTYTTATALGANNNNEQDTLSTTAIPNLYWAKPVGEYVIGASINAPFGSENEYDADYFGRYNHISASLKTIDYTVTAARQVNKNLRIGGGIYYQTLDIEQKKATHVAQTGTLKGDASDIGFSLGVQYNTGDTTIGLSHRSGSTQDITGTNTLVGTGAFTAGTYSTNATMKLPAITSLGIEHTLNKNTDLYFGTTHYNWSVYDSLTTTTLGIPQTLGNPYVSTTINNYKDTISYSVGVNHQYNHDLELRGGIHFDPTPTADDYRSHSTPDEDRTWLSLGLSKKMDKEMTIDFAFSHIMVDDAKITNKQVGSATVDTVHTISSTTETTHNILSIGIRKTF
ncbi:MAG: hypothetical protein HOL04_08685 [Gammaproteobacteria bacterium]|jgi:long-chain fatty acid transport protein|nr:hypothetical protein [Gammaproteobacteria bacterium]MBT4605581.1 hypothetical protein [Thiotrichales bacterium]MBT3472414.1 hypothetical protein [Gammaproteobacteria bacterium]MBT3968019.1 hypothetical protein [Gammaproteobacteria bacterium]MBT4080001.1 hypothetical protein [Gammaproteobacteria bacterium]